MHSTRFPIVSGLRWFAVVVMALMLAAGSLFVINGGGTAYAAGTLTITAPSNPLPAGTVGTPYSQTLSANGTSLSWSWSSTGTLPAGLSLGSSNGTIEGTPTTSGTFSFTVDVSDGSGNSGSTSLSLTINPALSVTTTSLPPYISGSSYSRQLAATGGDGTYTWTETGTLPSGFSLVTGGLLSGSTTVSTTTSYPITVTVTDTSSPANTATQSLTLTIEPAVSVTTTSLPAGEVNGAYSQTLSATGGDGGPYTWTASLLPSGLTLSGATISGTPTASGSFTVTATATDTNGDSGSRTLTLTINAAVSVTTTPPLPVGTVGAAYSDTLSATGGSGTYTWSISAGTLPSGLTLGPTSGIISGTPTASGTSIFSAQATDNITTTSTELQIVINPALSVTTASFPAGTAGTPYSQTLSATGGSGTYTWSITTGSLPGGLTLGSTSGIISGTPTGSGSTFTVMATDTNGATGTKTLTLTVNQPPPTTPVYGLPAPVTIPLGGSQTGLTLSTQMLAVNTVSISSPDNTVNLTIPKGTLVEQNGKAPSSISLTPISNAPPLPQGESFIGLPVNGQPSGLVFDPAISMVWHIGALPAGVKTGNVRVAYYDSSAKQWVNVPATYDPTTGDVTATISHFTSYAVYILEPTPSTAPTTTATAPATATPPATAPATPTATAPTTPTATAPTTPTATAPATPTAPTPSAVTQTAPPAPSPASSTSSFNWGMLIGVVAAVVVALSILLWITGRKRLS